LAVAFRLFVSRAVELAFFARENIMQKILLIGLAGLVGTLCRYWLSGLVARQYGETFPWGTLVVNVLGCFLAGSLFYLMEERFLVSPTLRTVILIGLLGGFTTFSSFGLQTFTLLREGEFALAALNVTLSNFLGLLMLWLGYSLVKAL
jgi:fluoride exporter